MKVLVTSYPSLSHLMPMMPLCWALRAAGHEVLVACPPDFTDAARSVAINAIGVGAPRWPQERASRGTGEKSWERISFPLEFSSERDTAEVRVFEGFLATEAALPACLEYGEYLQVADDWGADLLLHDPFDPVARLVGAVLGLPVVMHRFGLDPTPGPFAERTLELLRMPALLLGLADAPGSTLIVDPCPPSLQLPDVPSGHLVRYVPFNGAGDAPSWSLRRSGRRRICVCIGRTLGGIIPSIIRRTIEATSGLDGVELIVAAAPETREHLGEVGADVRILESFPMQLVLPSCDLCVHQGGAGTGLTASALGVPQLVFPQMGPDQFGFGSNLAEQGAGINLPTAEEQSDIGLIRSSAAAILGDESYRAAAEKLRAEIESAPSPGSLVPVLEDLVLNGR
ncbi:nucleotide disphospho-sugar-binding domain-containing protein [Saccharopolyspora shandongensis]|uniref:nucleotide disphospho-sugar-binding domain-containing protein n=1 Tax=Saccharopolyspora shandongensis TaxID=418495 RepID=UPI0033E99E02